MSVEDKRYWLLGREGLDPGANGEATLRAEDFVCCEVPAGGDAAATALEVFTSREGAEAELRGIESLAPVKHRPREAEEESGRVVRLLGTEIVELLEGSGVPFLLVDPPPVDGPISGGLCIKPVHEFAEETRRRLWMPDRDRV